MPVVMPDEASSAASGAPDASDASDASATRRRLGLATVDQIVAGIASVVTVIWVANQVDQIAFGQFALVQMLFVVAQVAFRGLISTTVLVHPEDADGRAGSVVTTTLVLAVPAAVLCLIAGAGLLAVDSGLGAPVIVLAAALPLLLLQDVGRYLAIARQRPSGALLLDVVWLVGVVAGFLALGRSGSGSLVWYVAAWAGAGALSGALALVTNGVSGPRGLSWIVDRWGFSWRSLVGSLAASGSLLVTSSLMVLFSGPLAVAAFRAATLLSSPSTAVQLAVSTATAAEIARVRHDRSAVARHARRVVVVSCAVGAVNLAVLMVLPARVGELVLGDTWSLVEPLLLAISLRVLLAAVPGGWRASLLGRRRIQVAMVTDIVSITLVGACMVVGAIVGDAAGAIWGTVVGTGVSAVCWWVALLWDARHPGAEEPDGEQAVTETPAAP